MDVAPRLADDDEPEALLRRVQRGEGEGSMSGRKSVVPGMIVAIAWAALLMKLGMMSFPVAMLSIVLAGVAIAIVDNLT